MRRYVPWLLLLSVFLVAQTTLWPAANTSVQHSPQNYTLGAGAHLEGHLGGIDTALASAGGGHTIQDDGTPLTQREALNFTGLLRAQDNAGADSTDVDFTGGTPIGPEEVPIHLPQVWWFSPPNTNTQRIPVPQTYYKQNSSSGGAATSFTNDWFSIFTLPLYSATPATVTRISCTLYFPSSCQAGDRMDICTYEVASGSLTPSVVGSCLAVGSGLPLDPCAATQNYVFTHAVNGPLSVGTEGAIGVLTRNGVDNAPDSPFRGHCSVQVKGSF